MSPFCIRIILLLWRRFKDQQQPCQTTCIIQKNTKYILYVYIFHFWMFRYVLEFVLTDWNQNLVPKKNGWGIFRIADHKSESPSLQKLKLLWIGIYSYSFEKKTKQNVFLWCLSVIHATKGTLFPLLGCFFKAKLWKIYIL